MELALPTREHSAKPANGRPIDLVHLSRMTFGDRALEREVLQLFLRQSSQIVAKLAKADTDTLAQLAHTLKGSGAGVGAWAVADAATVLEQGAKAGKSDAGVAKLRSAVTEASGYIEELLRAH